MFDVLVIGGGLIGSAALRHLSGVGVRAGLIGPDEPDDWARHDGVFASHYDQGRTTRSLDKDEVWGRLAQRSIARYEALEAASGIRFHEPCGFLHVGPPPGSDDDKLARVEAVGRRIGTRFERLDDAGLAHRFPYLTFPPGYAGLYEQSGAGWINPRTLVRAQQTVARNQNATIIRFFQSGGDAQRGEELRGLIQTLLPDVPFDGGLPKPCILTYTPHNRPMVAATGEAGLFVVVGGCGGAAKSSDEIGRMAALLVQHDAWTHDLDAALFRACFR